MKVARKSKTRAATSRAVALETGESPSNLLASPSPSHHGPVRPESSGGQMAAPSPSSLPFTLAAPSGPNGTITPQLPIICETEKRIKINQYKEQFFEKFVKSQDAAKMTVQNGFIEMGGPVKILKKYQRFNMSYQCLSDELKFVAVCEMMLEGNRVYEKKGAPPDKSQDPNTSTNVQVRPASKMRMVSDLDDIAIKSTQKGTIDTQKTDGANQSSPAILRDQIKIIQIANCSIIQPKLNFILMTLKGAQKLKYLQISKNKNSIKQATSQTLLNLFDSLPQLQTFHLDNCEMSETILHGFMDTLSKSKESRKLKQLGLIDMGATFEHLPPAPRKPKTEKQKAPQQSDQVPPANGLQNFLSSKGCKLQTLYLNGNNIALKGAMVLAQGLCLNKTIRILDLSRNHLGHQGVKLIVEALFGSPMLRSLDLSYNRIGNVGALALSRLLSKSNLLELRIQGNEISQEGMSSLFGVLSKFGEEKVEKKRGKKYVNPVKPNLSKLKILDLSVNKLQIGILHSFRQFLEANRELYALSISGFERVNQRAFRSICESLSRNEGLQTLDMGNLCQWQVDCLNNINRARNLDQQIQIVPPQRIVPPSASMLEASKDDIEQMMEVQDNMIIQDNDYGNQNPLFGSYDVEEPAEQGQQPMNPWDEYNGPQGADASTYDQMKQSYQKKFSVNDFYGRSDGNNRIDRSPSVTQIDNISTKKSNFDDKPSPRHASASNSSGSFRTGTGRFTSKLQNIDTTSTQLLFKERKILNIKTNQKQGVKLPSKQMQRQYQDDHNYVGSQHRHYLLQGTKSSQGQSIISITAASPTPSHSIHGATPSHSIHQISQDERVEVRGHDVRQSPQKYPLQQQYVNLKFKKQMQMPYRAVSQSQSQDNMIVVGARNHLQRGFSSHQQQSIGSFQNKSNSMQKSSNQKTISQSPQPTNKHSLYGGQPAEFDQKMSNDSRNIPESAGYYNNEGTNYIINSGGLNHTNRDMFEQMLQSQSEDMSNHAVMPKLQIISQERELKQAVASSAGHHPQVQSKTQKKKKGQNAKHALKEKKLSSNIESAAGESGIDTIGKDTFGKSSLENVLFGRGNRKDGEKHKRQASKGQQKTAKLRKKSKSTASLSAKSKSFDKNEKKKVKKQKKVVSKEYKHYIQQAWERNSANYQQQQHLGMQQQRNDQFTIKEQSQEETLPNQKEITVTNQRSQSSLESQSRDRFDYQRNHSVQSSSTPYGSSSSSSGEVLQSYLTQRPRGNGYNSTKGTSLRNQGTMNGDITGSHESGTPLKTPPSHYTFTHPTNELVSDPYIQSNQPGTHQASPMDTRQSRELSRQINGVAEDTDESRSRSYGRSESRSAASRRHVRNRSNLSKQRSGQQPKILKTKPRSSLGRKSFSQSSLSNKSSKSRSRKRRLSSKASSSKRQVRFRDQQRQEASEEQFHQAGDTDYHLATKQHDGMLYNIQDPNIYHQQVGGGYQDATQVQDNRNGFRNERQRQESRGMPGNVGRGLSMQESHDDREKDNYSFSSSSEERQRVKKSPPKGSKAPSKLEQDIQTIQNILRGHDQLPPRIAASNKKNYKDASFSSSEDDSESRTTGLNQRDIPRGKFSGQKESEQKKVLKQRYQEYKQYMDYQKHKKVDITNVSKVLMAQVAYKKNQSATRKDQSTIESAGSRHMPPPSSAHRNDTTALSAALRPSSATPGQNYHGGSITSTLLSHPTSSFTLSPSQKALLKQQMMGMDSGKARQLREHHQEQQRRLEAKRSTAVEKLQRYKQMYQEVKKQGVS